MGVWHRSGQWAARGSFQMTHLEGSGEVAESGEEHFSLAPVFLPGCRCNARKQSSSLVSVKVTLEHGRPGRWKDSGSRLTFEFFVHETNKIPGTYKTLILFLYYWAANIMNLLLCDSKGWCVFCFAYLCFKHTFFFFLYRIWCYFCFSYFQMFIFNMK